MYYSFLPQPLDFDPTASVRGFEIVDSELRNCTVSYAVGMSDFFPFTTHVHLRFFGFLAVLVSEPFLSPYRFSSKYYIALVFAPIRWQNPGCMANQADGSELNTLRFILFFSQ